MLIFWIKIMNARIYNEEFQNLGKVFGSRSKTLSLESKTKRFKLGEDMRLPEKFKEES